MRISWKSFVFSFLVAVLLFSLVMACICSNVFKSFVPFPVEQDWNGKTPLLANEARNAYESYLFYCKNKDNTELDFAMLVRVDAKEKKFLVTPVEGKDLLEKQGSLFYIRSLCQSEGIEVLVPIFSSLTGYEVSSNRILNARDYLPSTVKDTTIRYYDFVELLPTVWEDSYEGYEAVEYSLVTEDSDGLKIINTQKSLEAFGGFEIK